RPSADARAARVVRARRAGLADRCRRAGSGHAAPLSARDRAVRSIDRRTRLCPPEHLHVSLRASSLIRRRGGRRMKTLLGAIVAVTVLAATSSMAFAADEKKNTQQERMKACNTEAGDKKGDERKAFMSQCLKGEGAAPMTQQEKMKKCNADATAKSLKGDERKTFMSDCLKAEKKS